MKQTDTGTDRRTQQRQKSEDFDAKKTVAV